MSIHVALNHVTHYRYDRPIKLGPQVVRLRPAPHSRTRILSYSMRVEPTEHFINWQQDPQSNYLARLVFPKDDDLLPRRGRPGRRDGGAQPVRLLPRAERRELPVRLRRRSSLVELAPYLLQGAGDAAFVEYLSSIDRGEQPTSGFLVELNQRLQKDVAYLIRMEPGVQTPEQTLRQRAAARAATPAGCWCSCCATSASPRASSRAT